MYFWLDYHENIGGRIRDQNANLSRSGYGTKEIKKNKPLLRTEILKWIHLITSASLYDVVM